RRPGARVGARQLERAGHRFPASLRTWRSLMQTKRMTVGQALVEFLSRQWTVDGTIRERTVPGMFGIFGHGNVAGLGQALQQYNLEQPDLMPYRQARNEQAMVHQAVGFARMHRR